MTKFKDEDELTRCPKCHTSKVFEKNPDDWVCMRCGHAFKLAEVSNDDLAKYLGEKLGQLLRGA